MIARNCPEHPRKTGPPEKHAPPGTRGRRRREGGASAKRLLSGACSRPFTVRLQGNIARGNLNIELARNVLIVDDRIRPPERPSRRAQ